MYVHNNYIVYSNPSTMAPPVHHSSTFLDFGAEESCRVLDRCVDRMLDPFVSFRSVNGKLGKSVGPYIYIYITCMYVYEYNILITMYLIYLGKVY